jgi:hypothetical protein
LAPRLVACALVTGLALALLTTGWMAASRVAKRHVHAKVMAAIKKSGVPVEIGSWHLGLTGVRFDDVRIGKDAAVLISRVHAEVGLNPLDPQFLKLESVTIERVRLRAGAAAATSAVEREIGRGVAAAFPAGPSAALSQTAEKAVERLFHALPVPRLVVRSAAATLVDAEGKPTLTARGARLLADRRNQRILFAVDALKSSDGHEERNLRGRFELNPRGRGGKDYRFFVRRKGVKGGPLAAAPRNLWTVQGYVAKDLSSVDLEMGMTEAPAPLKRWLARYLDEHDAPTVLNLKGRLAAKRDGVTWRYDARLESLGTTVTVPLLSVRPVGPVKLVGTAQGVVRTDKKTITVDAAALDVPPRSGHGAPLRLALSATARHGAAERGGREIQTDETPPAWRLQARVTMPPTSCQTLLDAAPPGLVPALNGFRLDGKTSAALALRYDGSRAASLGAADAELTDAAWGCRVAAAPEAYTEARLNGPFTVRRMRGKGEEPVDLAIDPLSPHFTSLTKIGSAVNQAFVASEDAGFYHHSGVDLGALAGALRRNVAEGRIAIGGSTITMQLVKNIFLTSDRTLTRKLQEVFLAWHLENILTKDRILEIYLNVIEFGPGIYGITDAADHFFGKAPFDLNLLESAYLASLLPAPKARYRYYCDGQLSRNFASLVQSVLARMLALGRIDASRYAQALDQTLRFDDDRRQSEPRCEGLAPDVLLETAGGEEP